MKLIPAERETIILFSDADDTASVYTHDSRLIAKLKELHKKQPDKVYPERKEHPGAVSYIVPKAPFPSGSRTARNGRKAASERAKKAGYKPPVRGTVPKSD